MGTLKSNVSVIHFYVCLNDLDKLLGLFNIFASQQYLKIEFILFQKHFMSEACDFYIEL